jgi:hypothetical protein
MARSRNLVAEGRRGVEILRAASRPVLPQIYVSHETTALHARPAAMMACAAASASAPRRHRPGAGLQAEGGRRGLPRGRGGASPANPARRCRLGRTGVANLNSAPAAAFPSPAHRHASAHPVAVFFCLARSAPPSHQLLHRSELQERSAIPDTAAPKRRLADASPPRCFSMSSLSCSCLSWFSPLVLVQGTKAAARQPWPRLRQPLQRAPPPRDHPMRPASDVTQRSTRPDPGRTSACLFPQNLHRNSTS